MTHIVFIVALLLPGVLQPQDEAARLRLEAQTDLRRSDSLKKVWDVQWRRSDSVRIEAMFVRMRSDSLRKTSHAKTTKALAIEREQLDSIRIDSTGRDSTLLDSALVDSALRSSTLRQGKKGAVKQGQTLSDTLTMHVMTVDADTGIASYYAEAFHGKKTANGERYNMNDLTCAHRWLPYNTHLRVTNLSNGKSVIVRVTDRGPWKHTRLIDVSKGAAKQLEMIRAGTTRVAIEVVQSDN